jgi:hypothetical protein
LLRALEKRTFGEKYRLDPRLVIFTLKPVDSWVFSSFCIWHHARVLRRPVLLLPIGLGLVLGLVVGCSHADKPYAGPLPSKSSASPTPTKARPKPPRVRPTAPNARSAIAAAERANDALNVLYVNQDGKPLKALSNRSCGKCEAFYHAILTRKAEGYHFSGGVTRITGTPKYNGLNRETMTSSVSIPVATSAFQVTDPHGNPYNSRQDPAGGEPAYANQRFTCLLNWDGSHWLLQDFAFGEV